MSQGKSAMTVASQRAKNAYWVVPQMTIPLQSLISAKIGFNPIIARVATVTAFHGPSRQSGQRNGPGQEVPNIS